jgi:hypothetical protein
MKQDPFKMLQRFTPFKPLKAGREKGRVRGGVTAVLVGAEKYVSVFQRIKAKG